MQEKAKYWVKEVLRKGPSNVKVFIASNKMDNYSSSSMDVMVPFEVGCSWRVYAHAQLIVPHKQEVEAFMHSKGIKGWLPISAKKQVNVHRFFVMACTDSSCPWPPYDSSELTTQRILSKGAFARQDERARVSFPPCHLRDLACRLRPSW